MHVGFRPETHLTRAIIFILLAASFNALLSALTKFSYSQLTAMQMVFARNLIAFILFSGWLIFSKRQSALLDFLRPSSYKMQLVRGFAGFGSICFFILSLKTIDLSDAMVLFNTMPIFIPITAYLWRGIKIHHKTWWGMIIAFIGIIFIVQPTKGILGIGTIFALLSGIAGSISTLSLRFSHYSDPSSRTLFYYFLICTILSAVALPVEHGSLANAMSHQGILLLCGIGVLGLIFQVFFTLSTKYAPARLISPFYYSTVIFSVILDYLIWHVSIDFYKIVGIALVLLGVCLVVLLYPKEVTTSKPGAQ
jgi:drug/metabolite transporter (DMT)-like permease